MKRPGGRTARVRQAVVAAFIDELVERGYSDLSFESVAARAGVHKTTLYRRWGSRENLLLDVALQTAAEAVPVPDTGALVTDLAALAGAVAANLRSKRAQAMLRAVVSEALVNAEVATAARRFWQARFEAANEIIRLAAARGEVAADVDAGLIIELLIGPMYLRMLVTQEPIDDAFVGQLSTLVAHAATGPTATPATDEPSAGGA
jgi:AcrR family transcriptional regulator